MAYEIVNRLQQKKEEGILLQLKKKVTSLDLAEANSTRYPCSGVWNLADSLVDYNHSSAKYYIEGNQGLYSICD